MTETLDWFNVLLAIGGSAAALGSLNKMQFGRTRPCIGLAMLLLAVGLTGQWLGGLRGEWARVADTATFGGVLVLVLATQQVPSWFLERWQKPVVGAVSVLCAAAVLATLLGAAG